VEGVGDPCYPFNEVVKYELADKAHNNGFYYYICLWPESEIESFDDFMLNEKRNERR
jgi:hypothetical protein